MSSKKPVAIVFDTFGSVVDWRGSLVAEMKELGGKRGVNGDWAAVADAWRHGYHRMLDEVTTGTRDYGLLDALHRELLDEAMRDVGVTGFREDDLRDINLGWHRVKAWPDAVAGLTRLKTKYIVGSLSNGNVRLLVDMAKGANLPWDVVFGSDMFSRFKPHPDTYLGSARLLNLEPGEVMLASAHNGDLANARKYGLMTGFFLRPTEFGPNQAIDLAAEADWDVIADDIEDMATKLDT
ncbi:HAD-IA family hydrolase [Mesorhizobium sp. M7A.F.Ca.CA.001.11.2.1]|uniref:HAD-IA family hydrolase n=1 Tax=Mesorhizobium sp. M7A.F.Ca.CA.001.11.2.1 TaxID=2496693 RepID=UPI000FC9EC12|nr:HAD-IA family hydrolase [Mesorhizobium sp. M7A.F.Ca.CA.001.11.2.1]RVA73047.1 haloacid dehalogenase type II [Mesorhizobium sp. M7A.F.Ca.CA.001.11.2.1]